ncbi:MAG: DUF934 domain-containing protein [Rhodobacteraceae bacterium]|nr:DUF934 domain-containing protein [Paracoccaceae bacterium]
MSVLVTDTGFAPAGPVNTVALADLALHQGAVDLTPTDAPEALCAALPALHLIRIAYPAFSDGRAFTLARRLRMMGFAGELRALGPLLADQYAMLRRVGFDSVEIPDALAGRQPAAQWRFRADWQAHDYQARLRT